MSKLPKGASYGDRITFHDRSGGTLPDASERTGVVIDRAPQGWNPRPGRDADTYELGGYWLWVVPDDHRVNDTTTAVRVRYYSRGRDKGSAHREDGPMCITGHLAGGVPGGRKVTVQQLQAEVYATEARR